MITLPAIELAHKGEAHLYALHYSTGAVKVGRTAKPRVRITQLGHAAGAHGIDVIDAWISAPHKNATDNEGRLIAHCGTAATETRNREYFVGLDFHEVVRFADALPRTCWHVARVEDLGLSPSSGVDGIRRKLAAKIIADHVAEFPDEELPVNDLRRRTESLFKAHMCGLQLKATKANRKAA